MITNIDKLTDKGCSTDTKDKACRSRGGESCAFDGAMIVLQPIADTAHIVHGPIACCGNTWEGRGTLSSVGANGDSPLHKMGFTTDLNEMDIVYGSEEKLYKAILKTHEAVKPKAIFVYATCVSGLIGENIDAVCKKAETALKIRVIPANAPGFVGPKNLGNRIAGEVLLDYVIGTGEPPYIGNHNSSYPPHPTFGHPLPEGEGRGEGTQVMINLIGEYNIAGDLWLVEPVLNAAGIRILSRITGDSTFEEITYAHMAKLNVVVCSRALINVAKEMERKYGIPYIEVSFFGKTEMSKALREIAVKGIEQRAWSKETSEKIEEVIAAEEAKLEHRLKEYSHLKGKKAVLYTGGVKSWSFISALLDLGIEIVAVGTKKSTFEDEEKMKHILGENAPLVEDVTPKNLLRLLKERNADILVAGGRNQYLAVKEGYPFVDVNQERHTAYAGYDGLVNLAEQISNGISFYAKSREQRAESKGQKTKSGKPHALCPMPHAITINPLKHSQSIGAAMAFQGIHNAIPVIHGAQGCTFLGKVLLTKHFKEPIALAGTKLFTEDVVMGNDDNLIKVIEDLSEKNKPDIIGVLTTGLSEVKGDDVLNTLNSAIRIPHSEIIYVPTPDYEGGLETGYAKAVEAVIEITALRQAQGDNCHGELVEPRIPKSINVLEGPHLSPADFTELREIIESFGLRPIILPDLSALDGSRQGVSALATGGTTIEEIGAMSCSQFTLAIGMSMEAPSQKLKDWFGIEYKMIEGIAGLKDSDMLMETLSMLSNRPIPSRYVRQRRILLDGMRDAHFYFGSKKICLALEPDLAIQTSRLIEEMGAVTMRAIVPQFSSALNSIRAEEILAGDLSDLPGDCDLIISNSHAADTAEQLNIPLYQLGFPVYKVLGKTAQVSIGYRGSLDLVNEIANAFRCSHQTGTKLSKEVHL